MANWQKWQFHSFLFYGENNSKTLKKLLCHPSRESAFKLFTENSPGSSTFKSLAKKSNSEEPRFLHFFSIYNPKEVTVLINLISLVLGLRMIKNLLMHPATVLYCIFAQPLWISLFLIFFFIFKNFLSSNNTPGRVSCCQISSLLDLYFK